MSEHVDEILDAFVVPALYTIEILFNLRLLICFGLIGSIRYRVYRVFVRLGITGSKGYRAYRVY